MSEMEVNREKIQFLLIESTDLYLFLVTLFRERIIVACLCQSNFPLTLKVSYKCRNKNEKDIDTFHIVDIYEIQTKFLIMWYALRKFHHSRPCFTTDEIAYDVCWNFALFLRFDWYEAEVVCGENKHTSSWWMNLKRRVVISACNLHSRSLSLCCHFRFSSSLFVCIYLSLFEQIQLNSHVQWQILVYPIHFQALTLVIQIMTAKPSNQCAKTEQTIMHIAIESFPFCLMLSHPFQFACGQWSFYFFLTSTQMGWARSFFASYFCIVQCFVLTCDHFFGFLSLPDD